MSKAKRNYNNDFVDYVFKNDCYIIDREKKNKEGEWEFAEEKLTFKKKDVVWSNSKNAPYFYHRDENSGTVFRFLKDDYQYDTRPITIHDDWYKQKFEADPKMKLWSYESPIPVDEGRQVKVFGAKKSKDHGVSRIGVVTECYKDEWDDPKDTSCAGYTITIALIKAERVPIKKETKEITIDDTIHLQNNIVGADYRVHKINKMIEAAGVRLYKMGKTTYSAYEETLSEEIVKPTHYEHHKSNNSEPYTLKDLKEKYKRKEK